MKIKFDLHESVIDGIQYYGKLILGDSEESVSIEITVRENKGDLFVCYPSKYSEKDKRYYNTVYLTDDLYEKVNKQLNKKFSKLD